MTAAAPTPSTQAPLLVAGFFALVVASAGLTVAVWQIDALPEVAARTVALLFFLLIVPVEVLVHEGGHLAVAKLLGWRVPLVSWGPFTLRLAPLKLVFGPPAFGSTTAGAVVAVPPRGSERTWAWALLYAGGPLADGILAIAAFVASRQAPSEIPQGLLVVTAVIAALSGLSNLVPRGGSDGGQLLNVLCFRNGGWRGLNARLVEQTLRGVRPRDWPAALMAEVERLSLWSATPDLQLAVYAWHLDRGATGPARGALARSHLDERVLAEEAFCAAWFDRDAATARAILSRTRSWRVHAQTCYWRAAAALALIEDDKAACREALRKGRILVREGPYATGFDADWYDSIAREL